MKTLTVGEKAPPRASITGLRRARLFYMGIEVVLVLILRGLALYAWRIILLVETFARLRDMNDAMGRLNPS